jgi:hypothetical protein
MITGRPPFEADDVFGFVTKHLKERVLPMSEAHPEVDIPVDVDDIVLRMLEKDPTDRPSDAQALAVEMDPWVVEDPRLAEKGRALRTGATAVVVAAMVGGGLAAVQAKSLLLAPSAAVLGLAAGTVLAAIRVPRPSVYGYVRRLACVAGAVAVFEGAAMIVAGAPFFLAAAQGLVAVLAYVAFMLVWPFRNRWFRPLAAGLAAPFIAMLLMPVWVDPEVGDDYYVWFLGASALLDELEKVARVETLIGVMAIAFPFGLASMMLPRPGAARL